MDDEDENQSETEQDDDRRDRGGSKRNGARSGGFGSGGSRGGFGSSGSRSSFGDGSRSSGSRAAGGQRQQPRKRRYPERPDPDAEPVELTPDQRRKAAERAMNIAVWHLEQSPRTRKEIADRLTRKFLPADIIEDTLERLTKLGYLDDARFAEQFVRSRHEVRLQGASRISMELRRKGVDAEIASEAVDAIDADDERANARRLVDRKLRSTQGLDAHKRTARLVGMLARRGYGGVAYSVVREALAQEQDGSDEDLDGMH